MSIDTTIKRVQNIMRKDQGLAGDGQRIEQFAWMLFLKLFDDQERYYELRDQKYRSPIPEHLRWRAWAGNSEGVTGDGLLEFVNRELFPGLKALSASSDDRRTLIIRAAFEDAFNYMKSGTLIRQVVNEINGIDFNKAADRHMLGDMYERILKDLQGAGSYGEFYTPRPLTKFVVEMVDPKLGEKVLDPACGTGGFLVNAIEHMRAKYVKSAADEKKIRSAIHGVELKSLPHLLSLINMLMHGIEVPDNILHDDMLARPLTDYGPKDRVDVIVANPPFGASVKDGTEKNFPTQFRTKDTALLFLTLFIHLLKPQGRAGVVLPDGVLFGEGVASKIKQHLLETCNVHTIVRLPQGVFNPYAGVNTNLVFFNKGEPTKEVWYYQIPLPEGMKQYTKNRGITDAEFDDVRKWWGKRKEGPNAWKVPMADIVARNFNLDFKNPKGGSTAEHKAPKDLIADIEGVEKQIAKLLGEIKKDLNKAKPRAL